jgi:hypothetical protein
MNSIESELIFSKEGMLIRSKMNIPLVGEDWVEKKIPYEQAITNKLTEISITSIEPKIENGILKEIKLKLVDTKETKSVMQESFSTTVFVKADENIKIAKSIRRITRDAIKKVPPDGTKIRFDKNGITYETKIDIRTGEEDTLNTLVSDLFQTSDGRKASLNVWRDISARFYDGQMWHNLNELRA